VKAQSTDKEKGKKKEKGRRERVQIKEGKEIA